MFILELKGHEIKSILHIVEEFEFLRTLGTGTHLVIKLFLRGQI